MSLNKVRKTKSDSKETCAACGRNHVTHDGGWIVLGTGKICCKRDECIQALNVNEITKKLLRGK